MRLRCLSVALLASSLFGFTPSQAAEAKPLFESPIVTGATAGRTVDIDVDVTGRKQLFLVVNDGGDGFGCDWADWVEPRLTTATGEQKLTDLKWKSASAEWGNATVGKNAGGGPLLVADKAVTYGIGTHANSLIVYDLPAGATRFKAKGAVDDGGAKQSGSSVRFLVFGEQPPAKYLNPSNNSAQHEAADALSGLDEGPGVEATLFAAEPMLLSPSAMDVDHLGRVWICEVVNYRRFRNAEFKDREEGDRILVLEDTNHDGVADKQTVFYQGRDIDSAHGICVLGKRVIVSAGDSCFSLFDDNGDLKSDRKELLFTGIGGVNHDHGIHAFVFGPDGKLYFNFGNEGHQVKDKNGKPIIDQAGLEVRDHGQPYRQGMVFRCNLDGSEFETLGWNFRNNWETAVDSFGTLWQSDNDDDGNRGTRINFVMEFGNYGYQDELTGAGWSTPRTNMETDIPLRHWHLNDPGVVPNLLQTGAGSPTGICMNEGGLFTGNLKDCVIHCDAGPNITRGYPVEAVGAGYSATIAPILEGSRDKWFRPSDVCVAPDGTLLIADWYDPGVGGHRQQDIDRGRVFRITPKGSGLAAKYTAPKLDVTTVAGAIEGLQSPNMESRYLSYMALAEFGKAAEPMLVKLYHDSTNQRFRARALWLLTKLPGGSESIKKALSDTNSDIRITALRAARQLRSPQLVEACIRDLASDPSPAVRRECFVALRHLKSTNKAALWTKLAQQYDGTDRWYLEALGIGAGSDWDACLGAWLKAVGPAWNTPAGRDIVWRSRATVTPELLAKLIGNPDVPTAELPRYFRAFDFLTGEAKDKVVVQLAFATGTTDEDRQSLVMTESINRLTSFDLTNNPEQLATLNRILDTNAGSRQFVSLVDKFQIASRYPDLLAIALAKPNEQVGVEAGRALLARQQGALLETSLSSSDAPTAVAAATLLGNLADNAANKMLAVAVLDNAVSAEARQLASKGLSKSKNGSQILIQMAQQNQLEPALLQAAAFGLNNSPHDDIKARAKELFPLPPSRNDQPLPSIGELLSAKGDVAGGKLVFAGVGTCAKCHIVNGEGKEVGPNLSEIGSKLSKEAMFEAVLYPSAGISHNYETFTVLTDDGTVATGILVSQTPDAVTLRGADGLTQTIAMAAVEELKKQPVSLMPADLQKTMNVQELIDVVAYMQSLKKK